MSSQLLMSQVILQQRPRLTAEHYTLAQLTKRFVISEDWSIDQIDTWFRTQIDVLWQELLDLQIPEELIDPLFKLHYALHDAVLLNEESQQEILQAFKGPYDHEAVADYSKYQLDFYRLEKYLRFQTIDDAVPEGYLTVEDFKHYQQVDRLLLNSRYYRVLKGLNTKNLKRLTQLALNEAMEGYIWGLKVKESIFSMTYFRLQELTNVRAFLKAHRYGFDPEEFIYV